MNQPTPQTDAPPDALQSYEEAAAAAEEAGGDRAIVDAPAQKVEALYQLIVGGLQERRRRLDATYDARMAIVDQEEQAGRSQGLAPGVVAANIAAKHRALQSSIEAQIVGSSSGALQVAASDARDELVKADAKIELLARGHMLSGSVSTEPKTLDRHMDDIRMEQTWKTQRPAEMLKQLELDLAAGDEAGFVRDADVFVRLCTPLVNMEQKKIRSMFAIPDSRANTTDDIRGDAARVLRVAEQWKRAHFPRSIIALRVALQIAVDAFVRLAGSHGRYYRPGDLSYLEPGAQHLDAYGRLDPFAIDPRFASRYLADGFALPGWIEPQGRNGAGQWTPSPGPLLARRGK
jgi:hypothetical protein